MKIPGKILSILTNEQKKIIESVRSPEELHAIAKEFGQELTQEQLEAVSGETKEDWCLRDTGEKENPWDEIDN